MIKMEAWVFGGVDDGVLCYKAVCWHNNGHSPPPPPKKKNTQPHSTPSYINHPRTSTIKHPHKPPSCSPIHTRFSTRTTPLSTLSVSPSSVLLYTTPGQSIRKMRLVRVMYCHTLVSPGIGAALHTWGERWCVYEKGCMRGCGYMRKRVCRIHRWGYVVCYTAQYASYTLSCTAKLHANTHTHHAHTYTHAHKIHTHNTHTHNTIHIHTTQYTNKHASQWPLFVRGSHMIGITSKNHHHHY